MMAASTFSSAQKVGIGEPSPSEKLEVNGRIAAKGYKNTILTVDATSTESLSAAQVWTAIPDLTQTFTLDEATTVIATFGVVLQLQVNQGITPEATLALVIDGVRVAPCLNNLLDAGKKIHFANQYITELSAGTHTISLEYYLFPTGPYLSAPTIWKQLVSISSVSLFVRCIMTIRQEKHSSIKRSTKR